MIVTAVVLAIIAAVCDKVWGIPAPWRTIIYAGVVVLFIVGLILLLAPGLFSGLGLGRY